jgi:hypothetical protein
MCGQCQHLASNNINPSLPHLFIVDFVAQAHVWQKQGDCLLIFMHMNTHVLRGGIAKYLLNMGLQELPTATRGIQSRTHMSKARNQSTAYGSQWG